MVIPSRGCLADPTKVNIVARAAIDYLSNDLVLVQHLRATPRLRQSGMATPWLSSLANLQHSARLAWSATASQTDVPMGSV